MFPIVINDGKQELPNDDIMYIIAKDGIFLKKKLGLIKSITKVQNISILDSIETNAEMFIESLPLKWVARTYYFFQKVYELYRSEAVVLLYYNEEKKDYIIHVPVQKVTFAGISYVRDSTYQDYTLVGTIHSHGSMSAFHSGVDDSDEKTFDGLHITFGHIDSQYFSISSSIVSNGQRFVVTPERYLDGIELIEYVDENVYNYIWKFGKKEETEPKTKLGYQLNVQNNTFGCPEFWLEKVTKEQYGIGNRTNIQIPFSRSGGVITSSYNNKTQQRNDFNPCRSCVFRNHKINLEMKDFLLEDDNKSEKVKEVQWQPDDGFPPDMLW